MKRSNQRQWRNNKKSRWEDQPHVPSFPDHLLSTEGVPSDVAKELQSILDRARAYGMEQIDSSIQVEDASYDTDDDEDEPISYGETINNDFNAPVGHEEGATGVTIEYDGVLHAQYCHFDDIYY